MERDPLSGDLFGFINRRANQIKILYFDRSGWCVWSKRLERGRLVADWSGVRTREMDWTGLKLLLEGIEPKQVRLRYRHGQTASAREGR
jgi:transposase